MSEVWEVCREMQEVKQKGKDGAGALSLILINTFVDYWEPFKGSVVEK